MNLKFLLSKKTCINIGTLSPTSEQILTDSTNDIIDVLSNQVRYVEIIWNAYTISETASEK
jgi:hypothetical protein